MCLKVLIPLPNGRNDLIRHLYIAFDEEELLQNLEKIEKRNIDRPLSVKLNWK